MRRISLFGHFGLKLISLVTALFLWIAVSGEETVERGLRVPLELQQLPPNLEITGEVPTTVDVRLRGGSGALSRVNPGDAVAVLDLRAARPGRRVFSLTQDQVRVPFGVDVVQIAPSAIAMVFETTASRQVQVVPAIDGRPAAGFVIGPTTSDPATVEVVGPETAVKHATEAVTEPVPVAGASERVRETVTLGLLDPSLRLKNVRSATITVQILPGPQERLFRNRAVHLRNVPQGLTARAEPTAVDVSVRGARDALARLEPDEVVAYVDLAGLGAGEYQLSVHAEAARDAGVTHIDPLTVQIRMTSVR